MFHTKTYHEETDIPLTRQRCRACEGGVQALSLKEIDEMKSALDGGWTVVDHHHLSRRYGFDNFKDALHFTNQVGALAESEGHHPDITVGWGKAEIMLFTHAVDGLTNNDFILAAKISELLKPPFS
jgi:4a-hydroxytetrahydrobiopterin dehydratase